jgi:hypothetical protein
MPTITPTGALTLLLGAVVLTVQCGGIFRGIPRRRVAP